MASLPLTFLPSVPMYAMTVSSRQCLPAITSPICQSSGMHVPKLQESLELSGLLVSQEQSGYLSPVQG